MSDESNTATTDVENDSQPPAQQEQPEVQQEQPEGEESRPRRRRAASRAAGPPTQAVVFQAPAFTEPLPAKKAVESQQASEKSATVEKSGSGGGKTPDRHDADAGAPEATDEVAGDTGGAETDDNDGESTGAPKRRRRRGGRGRRKKPAEAGGQGAADDDSGTDDTADVDAEDDTADNADQPSKGDDAEAVDEQDNGDDSTPGSRRRRKRRRKGDSGEPSADDPPNTVVKVRDSRDVEDDSEVSSVKGSTRLEAKKQRRREGREAGRRRAPILSEAEFLARREAVDRVMAVRQEDDLTQIAVLEDDVLVEHYVSRASQSSLIGNIYLGRVQNVLPAMEAAFVDIGRGRNAVLYAGEVDWSEHESGDGQRRIEDVLKSGQTVLVQVTKDPVGHKGARLTSQISLPGRYVVYVPGGSMSGISRKLPDTERSRLKKVLKQVVPDDAGVIVRTAAEGASEEELTNDVARLRDQWASIQKKTSGNAPTLLQGEPDLAIKVVRDLFNEDFTKLVVSGNGAWDTINEYVTAVAGSLHDRLEKWTAPENGADVFSALRIHEQIAKALDRKVWLPSGGSLVIDRTEAMTVIDVNTGKFTGSGGNLEETVTKNNLEAAEEIVRQLRLRDIGGIIVIDFIDMVLESNRDLVLRRLVECLGRDRTKHQVAEVTSLGLVQMTRKRIGTGLLEAFSEPCPHCKSRGVLVHDHPIDESASSGSSSSSSSAGRSGRRRRRSGSGASDASSSNGSNGGSENESAEAHTPKLEASAEPGAASPADLMPVGNGVENDSATPSETPAADDAQPAVEVQPVAEDVQPVAEAQPTDGIWPDEAIEPAPDVQSAEDLQPAADSQAAPAEVHPTPTDEGEAQLAADVQSADDTQSTPTAVEPEITADAAVSDTLSGDQDDQVTNSPDSA